MANSLIVTGALVRLYINNVIYSVAQSVSLDYDLGTYPIYGINSPDPQSIDTGQRSVRGVCKGVRVKNSGGLQGINAIPLFSDIAAGNWVSLRLEERSSGETLWSISHARVSKITESVQIKGVYQVSFEFIGQILYYPLDLS